MLVNQQDTVSEDLLDGFYTSTHTEGIRYWLQILRTRPVPPDYYFNTRKQPLLFTDEILPDLQLTLMECPDANVIDNLVVGLKRRTDGKSLSILVTLLSHADSSVRYWAASALQGNNSAIIVNETIRLIKSPLYRTVALTDILLYNKIDTLQSTYESIYWANPDLDWKRSAVEYLATFPHSRHQPIFRAILQDKEEDIFIIRNAALGLGRLKDKGAVELIIKVCKEESEGSDYNAQVFLSALSRIKGAKARAFIAQYKNSSEEQVQELVNEILANW